MCWQQALNKGQTKVCCSYFYFFPSILPLFIPLTHTFWAAITSKAKSVTKCTLPEAKALYWNRWLKVEGIIPDTENVKTKAQIRKKKKLKQIWKSRNNQLVMSTSFKNRLSRGCGGIWLSDKEPSVHQINNSHPMMILNRWQMLSKQWFKMTNFRTLCKVFLWKENYRSRNMKLECNYFRLSVLG